MNVLIVDDENSFLLSLADGLRREFNVITADNGKKAVAQLKAYPIDVVVTDLKMPVMDGFELLAYMSKVCPETPALVMTAFGNPDVENKLKALDVSHYIEKPLDFEDLAAKIRQILTEGSGGCIRGITLPGFLQLVGLERKTCVLKVESGQRTGLLYFVDGELVDAETRGKTGEDAAYEIICWDEVTIEKRPAPRSERGISIPG